MIKRLRILWYSFLLKFREPNFTKANKQQRYKLGTTFIDKSGRVLMYIKKGDK